MGWKQELRFETSEALRQVQDPSALLVLQDSVISVFVSVPVARSASVTYHRQCHQLRQ